MNPVKNIFSTVKNLFVKDSEQLKNMKYVVKKAKELLGTNDIILEQDGGVFNWKIKQLSRHFKESDRKDMVLKSTQLPFNGQPIVTNDFDMVDNGIQIEEFAGAKLITFRLTETNGERALRYYAYTKEDAEKIDRLYSSVETEMKKTRLPENGIYVIEEVRTMFGSQFVYKPAELQKNPVVCDSVQKITEDVKFFFNNIPLFSRMGQKPSRKILMAGEPGTGKTSICYKIAEEFKNDAIIVYVDDYKKLAQHVTQCSVDNRKTIVICEDADTFIDGCMLNFLDGIERENIKDGLVMLFTTNHPERMEKRITKRPGRIDKIYKVGNITNSKDILEVFNIYFGEYVKEEDINKHEEAIVDLLLGCTGAQIKELSNTYVQYIVSNGIEGFNFDTLCDVKNNMFEAYGIVDSNTQESIEAYNRKRELKAFCDSLPDLHDPCDDDDDDDAA